MQTLDHGRSHMNQSRNLNRTITILCLISMTLAQTKALTSTRPNITALPPSAGEYTTQNTSFTYDINGNIVTKTVDDKKTIYTYNAINQLMSIQKPDGSITDLKNDYDTLGNMKHDPDGNEYQYNLLNKLTEYQNTKTATKADYQYYANGLRSKKTITTNPTIAPIYYYYDDANNANITNEKQGQLKTSYLLPNTHMIRYLQNGQGSIQKQVSLHSEKDIDAILNDQGKIQQTYHYSPNGIIKSIGIQSQITQTSHLTTTDFSITKNPFQYSGQYRDPESGLDYLRARYYSPQIQRFIQRDSYSLLNRYAYVKGNPITNTDPSGHISKIWKKALYWSALLASLITVGALSIGVMLGEVDANGRFIMFGKYKKGDSPDSHNFQNQLLKNLNKNEIKAIKPLLDSVPGQAEKWCNLSKEAINQVNFKNESEQTINHNNFDNYFDPGNGNFIGSQKGNIYQRGVLGGRTSIIKAFGNDSHQLSDKQVATMVAQKSSAHNEIYATSHNVFISLPNTLFGQGNPNSASKILDTLLTREIIQKTHPEMFSIGVKNKI